MKFPEDDTPEVVNQRGLAQLSLVILGEDNWYHPNELPGFLPRNYPLRFVVAPTSIRDFACFSSRHLREMARLLRKEALGPTPRYTVRQAEMRALALEKLADEPTN